MFDIESKKIQVIIVLALFLVTFVTSLLPIKTESGWDETVYLQNAETIFFGRTNYDELSFRPPLLSIIFGLGFLIWHSQIFASIITAAIATLAPIFVFLIGKKIYNAKVGLIAALLIGFSPFVIQNANFLMTDVPVMSLMAVSFYLSLFREKKGLLFLSGVFLSLSVLMKFNAILMLPVMLLYFSINKTKFQNIIFFGFGAFLTILPYLIWAQIQFGNFLSPFIKGESFVRGLNENNWFYFKNIFTPFTLIAPIGFLLFILFSIGKFIKKRELLKKNELVFLFWIIILIAFLIHTPHKELRYIIPIGVPFVLLSSRGIFYMLNKFLKNEKKIQILIVSFSFLLLIVLLIYHSYFFGFNLIDNSKSNVLTASNYLTKDLNYTGTLYFFISDPWPVFAYYTGLNITLMPWAGSSDFYLGAYSPFMKYGGVLVINNQTKSDPKTDWMDNNPQFILIGKDKNFYFYKYKMY